MGRLTTPISLTAGGRGCHIALDAAPHIRLDANHTPSPCSPAREENAVVRLQLIGSVAASPLPSPPAAASPIRHWIIFATTLSLTVPWP